MAAAKLEELPFELYEATNSFGDEFAVLYLPVGLEQYVELGGNAGPLDFWAMEYKEIAKTTTELLPKGHVRFIAIELAQGLPTPVPSPVLGKQYSVVEAALSDAEQLLRSGGGARSALDRAHTALHGYLLAQCAGRTPSPLPTDGSFQAAFGYLQQHHPALKYDGTRSKEIGMVLSGCAKIIEASNTLRNKVSMAHPNQETLPEAEAMLVINAMRSILHYLEMKLHPTH